MGAERLSVPPWFKLEEFVDNSVRAFLSVVRDAQSMGNELTQEAFYNSVKEGVCGKLGISQDLFVYLHHSIHWAFFCSNGDSPFKIEYRAKADDGRCIGYVVANSAINNECFERLSAKVKEEYLPYLKARLQANAQQEER